MSVPKYLGLQPGEKMAIKVNDQIYSLRMISAKTGENLVFKYRNDYRKFLPLAVRACEVKPRPALATQNAVQVSKLSRALATFTGVTASLSESIPKEYYELARQRARLNLMRLEGPISFDPSEESPHRLIELLAFKELLEKEREKFRKEVERNQAEPELTEQEKKFYQ